MFDKILTTDTLSTLCSKLQKITYVCLSTSIITDRSTCVSIDNNHQSKFPTKNFCKIILYVRNNLPGYAQLKCGVVCIYRVYGTLINL